MSKHFAWEFVTDNHLLMLHTEVNPTDEEWDEYIDRLSRYRPSELRLLVLTAGGAPGTAQRNKLNKWIGDGSFRRAVVTEGTIARGVLTALAWFDPAIKGFSPQQLTQAFEYLEINPSEQARYLAAVARLRGGMTLKSEWWASL